MSADGVSGRRKVVLTTLILSEENVGTKKTSSDPSKFFLSSS